jgi:hypothetical protein
MEIVYASLIGVAGMVLFLIFNQSFWLKKWEKNMDLEMYKTDQQYKFEKYKIKNRKIKNPAPKDISFWMDKAKGLDPDQIAELIDIFQGGSEAKESSISGNPLIDGILNFARSNPEIADKFVSQFVKKPDQDSTLYEK